MLPIYRLRNNLERLSDKLEKDETLSDFYLKGNIPYRFVGPSTPASPVCTEECFACGECIEVCPTHAIALSDEGK